MAKINPVKLKQDADRLEKAGKLDQAIAVFRQVIDDNPRDWNTINKVGDLYAKLNKNHEACEEYAKVADFYAKDGFLLKAIALWKKINRLEPAALGTYLNLADLYAKQGLMMEAKGQYQIVVEEYIKRGKMRDAGDILKKMAEIDPADLKVRSKLADLYTREGNQTKAIEEHVAIADELTKKGHLAEAAQVLEKGLKIDAKSARLRLELARVHAVQKNYEKAATVLEEAVRQVPNNPELLTKLGEAYLGCKKVEEAAAIFRRLLQSSPDDQECRIQMGRVYLLQGQFDMAFGELSPLCDKLIEKREGERGAALLQQIVQANPGHIRTLVKLAEVYRVLQKDAMIAATYAQLTEAYIQQGHFEQAAAVLEMLVSLEPTNQQHRTKLEFVRSRKTGGRAAPPPAASSAHDVEDVEFDLEAIEEFPGLDEAAPAPAAAPLAVPRQSPAQPVAQAPSRIELSGPQSEEDREFISEHLAEGKVFRKYGLVDKAAEQFEAVVARFPDHAEARLELRDVYKEKNQTAGVVEQCRALAQISRLKGDSAAAQAFEAEAAALTAPAAAAPAPSWEESPLEPAIEAEDEIPVQVEEEEEEAQEEDEIRLSFGEDVAVEEEEAEEELPAHFVDEQAEPELERAPALGQPSGAAPLFEPEPELQPQGLSSPDVFDGDEAGELDLPFEAGAAPEPPAFEDARERQPTPSRQAAAEPALPAELARVLEEVDEYVSLGFVDDARDALREVRDRYAEHPALQAKVRELGLEETVAAPAAALGDEFPGLDVVEQEAPAGSFGGDEFPGLEAAAPEVEFPGLDVGEPVAAPAEPETEPEEELQGLFPTPAGTVPFRVEDEFPDLEEPAQPDTSAPAQAEPEFPDLETPEPAPALGLSFGDQLGLEEPQVEPEPELADGVLPELSVPSRPSRSQPSALSDLDSAFADLAPSEPGGLPASVAPSEGMDLGAELFGAIAAVEEPQQEAVQDSLGEAGLADIFREFKKGVDKQLGKEDYDTRYNLGIAYKEMGLLDEAIAEFQLAAKDSSRLLECSSMLGICFLEKGMPKLAVKWFEKGLATPGRNEEEYFGLRYDLATAYEADGDVSAAMGILLDLHSQDPDFRDVSGKLRELRALSSRS